MKKVLFTLLLIVLLSCSIDNETDTHKYITDDDFKIEVINWINYVDLTDDGIENYIIEEQGSGEVLTFEKKTGRLHISDGSEDEFASSSINGLLVFDNYWGTTSKVVDFTIDNEFSILYDSRNDTPTSYFELGKTIVKFKKIQ